MTNDQLKLVSDNPQVELKKVDNTYVLTISDDLEIKSPVELNMRFKIKDLRFKIKVGKNSKVTIIENFTHSIELDQEIIIGESSDLKLISIQKLDSNSSFAEKRVVNAGKNAKVHCFDFQLGGKTSKLNVEQNAMAETDVNSDVLCNAKKDQKFNFHVENNYLGENGRGKILIKSASSDASQIKIVGGINISIKGSGTDAHLKQDSLILSKNATIKAVPKLNINTDSVKAGHSASVINLNKESLFYLTSRGISEENARQMMIKGFMKEVVDKLSDLINFVIPIEA